MKEWTCWLWLWAAFDDCHHLKYNLTTQYIMGQSGGMCPLPFPSQADHLHRANLTFLYEYTYSSIIAILLCKSGLRYVAHLLLLQMHKINKHFGWNRRTN
jgi:hypothetical protein